MTGWIIISFIIGLFTGACIMGKLWYDFVRKKENKSWLDEQMRSYNGFTKEQMDQISKDDEDFRIKVLNTPGLSQWINLMNK